MMSAMRSDVHTICVRRLIAVGAAMIAMMTLYSAHAAPVDVRFPEGVSQGFLVLRGLDGKKLADGELRQTSAGTARLVSRLVFRFLDGSLHDETVVFSQKPVLTLVSYTLLQQGPSFPSQLNVSFERSSKTYMVRSRKDGREKEEIFTGNLELPPDVYNGLTVMVLKNLPPGHTQTIHIVAFVPEPKLYEVEIHPRGKETIQAGELRKQARRYELKPKLSSMMRFFADLFGKTIPAYHVWILADDIPAFVRFEGPLSTDGPAWRIELGAPLLGGKK
jgi:hypothetical protein